MARLGDFIGQMLSEMTVARVRADIESLRVAELYASHPLLRHMSVPRFRLPDIDIELPVISRAGAEGDEESPSADVVADEVYRHAVQELRAMDAPINRRRLQALRSAVRGAVREHATAPGQPVDTKSAVAAVRKATLQWVDQHSERAIPKKARSTFEARLESSARVAVAKLNPTLPRLEVGVTSKDIRDAGPEAVTRIRIRLSEEGLEWTSVETEEGAVDRLVME